MKAPYWVLAARHFGLDSAPAVTLAAHPGLIRKELKIPDDLSIIIGIALEYADAEHPQNKYRTPRRVRSGCGCVQGDLMWSIEGKAKIETTQEALLIAVFYFLTDFLC